jgi:hypothetical protein
MASTPVKHNTLHIAKTSFGTIGNMFRHQTIIAEDLSSFKYEAKDNRKIQHLALTRVFSKTGNFIFNIGIVNFYENAITTLFLAVYCYKYERSILYSE